MSTPIFTRFGYIGITGRPNVGKSTLLNSLIGEDLSITSKYPQTTRKSVMGSLQGKDYILKFIDTPGITFQNKNLLTQTMNKHARAWLNNVNVVLFTVEALRWTEADESICQILQALPIPVILVINKIDSVRDKNTLFPYVDKIKTKLNFKAIFPISAQKRINVNNLQTEIIKLIPTDSLLIPSPLDAVPLEERISEKIREKIFRLMGQEIPRETAVYVNKIDQKVKMYEIHATIVVGKESQKAMLIGKLGQKIKMIGTKARKDIELILKNKVHLQLWVDVKPNWFNQNEWLHEFKII